MNIFKSPKQYKTRTDYEWINGLKQIDEETIEDLWGIVFVYGTTVARRYDQGDDLGHDAAIAAFLRIKNKGIYQYKFDCPFLAYCRHIVVNEVKRCLKKLPEPSVELLDEIHEDEEEDLERLQIADNHVRARLAPCLELLSQRKRELIDKRYFEDALPQSIAENFGITRNNVNRTMHGARQKLRECLEQRGFFTTGDVLGL
jgi:RNA polymerase sigma factor (sigma-70 family)